MAVCGDESVFSFIHIVSWTLLTSGLRREQGVRRFSDLFFEEAT